MEKLIGADELARLNEPQKVHMDPNSQHQLWSLWSWTVKPAPRPRIGLVAFGGKRVKVQGRNFEEVKTNCLRFGRKAFGSTGQMNIQEYSDGKYIIKCRVEGHPVHDPAYVDHQNAAWTRFFVNGFGVGTEVSLETKLEAGDAQDGKPRDQLVIIPPFHIGVQSK
jgi:hypothetical protein